MTDDRILAHVNAFIASHNYDQAYELARSIQNGQLAIRTEMYVLNCEGDNLKQTRH